MPDIGTKTFWEPGGRGWTNKPTDVEITRITTSSGTAATLTLATSGTSGGAGRVTVKVPTKTEAGLSQLGLGIRIGRAAADVANGGTYILVEAGESSPPIPCAGLLVIGYLRDQTSNVLFEVIEDLQ